jgi:hypothetical protein
MLNRLSRLKCAVGHANALRPFTRLGSHVASNVFTADESFFRNVIRINVDTDAETIISDLKRIRIEHLSKQLTVADEIWKENARKELKDIIVHIREQGQSFPPTKAAIILNLLSRLNDFYRITRDNFARRALLNVFASTDRLQKAKLFDCAVVLKSLIFMERDNRWKVTPLPDAFLAKLIAALVRRIFAHQRQCTSSKRHGKWLDAHVTALHAIATYAAILPPEFVADSTMTILNRLAAKYARVHVDNCQRSTLLACVYVHCTALWAQRHIRLLASLMSSHCGNVHV